MSRGPSPKGLDSMSQLKVSLTDKQIDKIEEYANKYTKGNFSLAAREIIEKGLNSLTSS